ncbi:WhiB family transcriptional regulator [Gordonia sp. (in: high G+C Gram-positive bacteria)]|uniref:WhiB family transcriptional regulator n=1 Tax=Gordonia sp. (in: high G+C Gram-positive bacteria) TaxID=84139 RepID=UPI00352959EC
MTITELTTPITGTPEDSPATHRIDLPCQSGDADLWFAEEPAALETAKSLCRACPLQAPCLAEAVDRGEPWGVWGGEIFDRGVIIARKRPRGRPRKNAS